MENKHEYKRITDMPEQEQVGIKEYAMNPRRYQNALIESQDGLPKSILGLDEISMRQLINYTTKNKCEFTGQLTYLDKVVSFINSGAYPQEYLNKVFGRRYKVKNRKTTKGSNDKLGKYDEMIEEQEIEYYIRNKNEYAKIQIDALQNWEIKKLGVAIEEYLSFSFGKLNKEFIEHAILMGIKNTQDESIKLRYIKEGINVLGMNKGSNNLTQVNVYTEGGGKGLGAKISETTGNDNFVLMNDDNDVESDSE